MNARLLFDEFTNASFKLNSVFVILFNFKFFIQCKYALCKLEFLSWIRFSIKVCFILNSGKQCILTNASFTQLTRFSDKTCLKNKFVRCWKQSICRQNIRKSKRACNWVLASVFSDSYPVSSWITLRTHDVLSHSHPQPLKMLVFSKRMSLVLFSQCRGQKA